MGIPQRIKEIKYTVAGIGIFILFNIASLVLQKYFDKLTLAIVTLMLLTLVVVGMALDLPGGLKKGG